jgi:hypothetical protein
MGLEASDSLANLKRQCEIFTSRRSPCEHFRTAWSFLVVDDMTQVYQLGPT